MASRLLLVFLGFGDVGGGNSIGRSATRVRWLEVQMGSARIAPCSAPRHVPRKCLVLWWLRHDSLQIVHSGPDSRARVVARAQQPLMHLLLSSDRLGRGSKLSTPRHGFTTGVGEIDADEPRPDRILVV